MAEINKLSVSQALDKLRRNDASNLKVTRTDEKVAELDKEIERLRAANRRLERGQRANLTVPDAPKVNPSHIARLKIPGIIVGIVFLIAVVAWSFGLL